MHRISSSVTLFLKLFIPTFWIVFFGSFTLAILTISPENAPVVSRAGFKIGTVVFYLTGILILGISFFRLQRVEIDSKFLYVTNYFKTYRYPHEDIEKIKELELFLFKLGIIYLMEAGSFGRKIIFVQSRQKFEDHIKSSQKLGRKIITS